MGAQPSCPACGEPVAAPVIAAAGGAAVVCPACQVSFLPEGASLISLPLRAGGPVASRSQELQLPPQFLARYQLGRQIGEGAFGRVFEAEQRGLRRRVAIKLLLLPMDPPLVERFLREGRLMSRLTHPNLVQIFDLDTIGNQPYLVLEHLTGGTLRQRLKEAGGGLPIRELIPVLFEAVAGLAACHAASILHRDVKPENILFDAAGMAHLGDLGLALDEQALERLTRTGALVGTPKYMAPEIIRGQPAGPATDLYALGVMIYESVLGRHPFEGLSHAKLLHDHLNTLPPEPKELGAAMPAWLRELVWRLLAKDPGDRPSTAVEVIESLARGAGVAERAPARNRSHGRRVSGSATSGVVPRRSAWRVRWIALVSLLLAALAAGRMRTESGAVVGGPAATGASSAPAKATARVPPGVTRRRRAPPGRRDPLITDLLALPYQLDPGLKRTRFPPGPLLTSRLDPTRRETLRRHSRELVESQLVLSPGLPLDRWLAAVPGWLVDPTSSASDRHRIYEMVLGLADVDAATELVLGSPLLDVESRVAAYARTRRGEPAPAGYRPVAELRSPNVRRWLSHALLPIFARRGLEFRAGNITSLASWSGEGQFFAGADSVIEELARPEAASGRLWFALGRLQLARVPGGGLDVWLSAVDLEPSMRLWVRFGGRHSVCLANTIKSFGHDPPGKFTSERSTLAAFARTLSATVPPDLVGDGEVSIEVAADEFSTAAVEDLTASRYCWLADLVVASHAPR